MEPPAFRIRLFGELDIRRDGDAIPPPESSRATSLLAYLLLHRQAPQSREHLAFLLWPDSTEAQARTNLRHVLHHLRRALPDSDRFLDVTPRTLQWHPDAPFWLDVAEFEALATRADGDGDLSALREAVALYSGDLLDGWYDEWLLGERERLRQRYLVLLERLVGCLEARGDLVEAIHHAETLLRHDPLNESTYRLLMRLFAARGDRARALRLYHVCTTTLERELGVEPSPQTREAYEALLPVESEPGREGPQDNRLGLPLVGRIRERDQLAGLWRAAERGRSHFVLVTGESGIGKSRLAEELRSWCAHRGAAVAAARSYAAEGALAYAPVVAWLRSDALARHRHVIRPTHLSELTRLLPELLDEVPEIALPQPLPESEQRQRLFDALVDAILVVDAPLLLVVDDVQWSDRETIQFLHYLLRTRAEARLLVLATARGEEFDPHHPIHDLTLGLRALDQYTEIAIERLAATETTALAEQLAGRPLTLGEADQLYRETEGNPLFIVESMRAGWTDKNREPGWVSPRVQAVIQSRLARLSEPAREIVGIAATIGREFTIETLVAASGRDDETIVTCLDELWQRRIIREQGTDGYDFTHDKLREVAYGSLSPARRRHVHLRTAHALEQLHADDPGPVSGQLAAHYERAGAADVAVTWYMRAAEAAQHMHAYSEAVRLLRRGIDLLHTLPDTPARQSQELTILTALPGPLVATEGYHSTYGTQVHERALSLTRKLGVDPAPPLLWALATANLARGDLAQARVYAEQLRASGERDDDDVLFVQSEYVLGIIAYWNAEFVAAQSHFESAIARFKPADRRTHLLRYGQDPALVCQMRLAFVRWFLGHPTDARRLRDEAFAQSLTHDGWFTKMGVLHFAGLLSIELGDDDRVRESAAILNQIQDSRTTAFIQHNGDAIIGYVEVLDGRHEAGIRRIEQALDTLRTNVQLPGQRSSVGRAMLAARSIAGTPQARLAVADYLLAANDGARIWDAEARRSRAESLATLGASSDEVERELELASGIARRQGARSLELRVATSLLRHRLRHGDTESVGEARDLLTTLVASISDGADTADLRAATALLTRS